MSTGHTDSMWLEMSGVEPTPRPAWDVDYPKMFYFFGPRWPLTVRVAGYIAIALPILAAALCLLPN